MLALPSLPPPVAAHVAAAVACAPVRPRALLVADMSESSSKPRLWVFDLSDTKQPMVMRTEVAHGYGSDPNKTGMATYFSNVEGSGMTSLGPYRIAEPYTGKYGVSYRLVGLSLSDSHAYERNIMLHPAPYVSPAHVGRSAGCAAVAPSALTAMMRHFGSLTGGLLWIDGPGVQAPTCAATRWPAEWALPKGSAWAIALKPNQACPRQAP